MQEFKRKPNIKTEYHNFVFKARKEVNKVTIKEIEAYEKDFLTPTQVAGVLGCDPYAINCKAKADIADGKNRLQFPFVMIGSRVKIPRQAFLKFWKGQSE